MSDVKIAHVRTLDEVEASPTMTKCIEKVHRHAKRKSEPVATAYSIRAKGDEWWKLDDLAKLAVLPERRVWCTGNWHEVSEPALDRVIALFAMLGYEDKLWVSRPEDSAFIPPSKTQGYHGETRPMRLDA